MPPPDGHGKHGRKHHGDEGGHHGHTFADVEGWVERFEGPDRDAWQKPDEVIRELGLSPTARVAEIGAGTGYFAVRLARAVPGGRVWGIDVEPNMVRYMEARAAREGLANLSSCLATAEDAHLPEPVDLVLVVNVAHHIDERRAYFARLATRLAPCGRLVIIDFRKGDLPVGPPDEMKIAPDLVIAELEGAGLVQTAERTFLPHQYFLEFRKR